MSAGAPERFHEAPLPGRRVLATAEWGPADGRPVLLFPGAGMTRVLGFATDAVHDLGVRLICVDRPGLGASSASPQRTLLDWPDDVAALGLDDVTVVGYSQGAPFALACAAAGIARAVAIVAGTDELASFSGLDPQLSAVVEQARVDPAAAEAGFATMTPDTLLGMIDSMSAESDRAVYAGLPLREAVEAGFAKGPAGYARDTVLAMAPWPFALEDISVPVDLWYGGRDTSPVHSPDFGATLERRIPAARRHVDPDAGGAILWTHGPEILRTLLVRSG